MLLEDMADQDVEDQTRPKRERRQNSKYKDSDFYLQQGGSKSQESILANLVQFISDMFQ